MRFWLYWRDMASASSTIEAMDALGRSSKAILSTPDPYDFTANSALEIASRIASLPVPMGLVTPSQAFGPDFVLSLPGCSRTDIPARADASSRAEQGDN